MSGRKPTTRPIISITIAAMMNGRDAILREALRDIERRDRFGDFSDPPGVSSITIRDVSELDLEAVCDEIAAALHMPLAIGEPSVIYLETIRDSARAEGKYIRQTGGSGNYGHVKIRLEPNPRDKGFELINAIPDGAIPREYIASIEEGIREAMSAGLLLGYEVVDVKVTLIDGSYHDVDSNQMAYKIAASQAFKEAARKSSPILLEPVMEIEALIEEAQVGAVIADIKARRGRIESIEPHAGFIELIAHVPLREMLRSSKHGRPDYPMQFAGYEEVHPPYDFGDFDAGVTACKPTRPRSGNDSAVVKPDDDFESLWT